MGFYTLKGAHLPVPKLQQNYGSFHRISQLFGQIYHFWSKNLENMGFLIDKFVNQSMGSLVTEYNF